MREYEYNNVSLPFDIYDVGTLTRYENAIIALGRAEKAIPKDGKQSDVIKAECAAIRKCFDDIFGDGTAAKLFADRMSLSEIMDGYEALLQCVVDQREAMQKRVARYSPHRVTRR